jgi:outer membrane receptor protein involved in Fe transport
VTNKPDFAIGQAAYTLQNIRLAYRSPSGNFEISGWVRNITDQRYKTYAFDATYFARVVINFVADPRTGGVDLTFNF